MQVVVLSNDALFREGLQCLLSNLPWCVSTETFESFGPLAAFLNENEVDAVVVPIDQVEISDLASLGSAKASHGIKVLAIASSDTLHAPMDQLADRVVNRSGGFEALRNGLRALDNAAPAGATLQVREPAAIYGTPRQLTQRERQVAKLISQGLPNRRIATVLGIQEQSVKNLVSVVMRKLDCENRVQVALHLSAPSH